MKTVDIFRFQGMVVASVISWSVNKSICWVFLHGVFGWGYVAYFVLGRGH